MENEEVKKLAEESLLRSTDDISDDKEILEKLNGKVIIIKESNSIEVKYPDERPTISIPLYLIAKFMGFKILNFFSTPIAKTEELAKSLHKSPQALSRPIGILTGDLIDESEGGYKIRAYRILNFLRSLDDNSKESFLDKKNSSNKKSSKINTVFTKIAQTTKFELKKGGIENLASLLNLSETELRNIFFFRRDDPNLLAQGLLDSDSISEKQLIATLSYLMVYKYCYNSPELLAGVLRSKLKKLSVPSLVNLTTNLHKFPEFILHDADSRGSQNNFYIITPKGEEYIKNKISLYFKKNG